MNRAHRLTAALGGIALALGGVLVSAPAAHADDWSPVITETAGTTQNGTQNSHLCSGSAYSGLVNVGCSPINV